MILLMNYSSLWLAVITKPSHHVQTKARVLEWNTWVIHFPAYWFDLTSDKTRYVLEIVLNVELFEYHMLTVTQW